MSETLANLLIFMVNFISVGVILALAFCSADSMTRNTRMTLRIGYILVAVGAFGAVMAPLFGVWPKPTWQQASIHSGLAMIMFFSRRKVS